MACDTRVRTPEVGKVGAALKRNGEKITEEPGHNDAYHTPRCDVESSTAEYTSVEENDRKLNSAQSASRYNIDIPEML